MSMKEYWHEKAEESRHNETLAYQMFIAGAIFFVGGVLETLLAGMEKLSWFGIIPYQTSPSPTTLLGLFLTLCGLALLVFGIVSGIYYANDRAWYMNELQKAHSLENSIVQDKKKRKRNTSS
ncbi:MAG: hypothetical protein QXN63_01580 [Candidatus Bathyarchaeia archaeon]